MLPKMSVSMHLYLECKIWHPGLPMDKNFNKIDKSTHSVKKVPKKFKSSMVRSSGPEPMVRDRSVNKVIVVKVCE